MSTWHDRFFSSTRGRVIDLLRRGEATVADLAEEIDVTKNAVRSHLDRLGRDGLVTEVGKRPAARKPETLYGLTEEAEELYPRAYDLLLSLFLEELEERLDDEERREILDRIGRRLAERRGGLAAGDDLRARVEQAAGVLDEMGGMAEVVFRDEAYEIRGFSCPLAGVVSEHPDVCGVAEVLLAEITGASVREMCDHGDTPRCRFEVEGGREAG